MIIGDSGIVVMLIVNAPDLMYIPKPSNEDDGEV